MNVTEFRAGVCAWLAEHDLSPGPDHSLDGQVAQLARVRRALFDAGWIRYGRLLAETAIPDEAALGSAYLALHTVRCRSHATQRRLAEGERLGPETSVDKVLLATAEQQLYDTARELLPGAVELTETPWRSEYLYSRAVTIYGGTAEIQRNIIARRLLRLGRD